MAELSERPDDIPKNAALMSFAPRHRMENPRKTYTPADGIGGKIG